MGANSISSLSSTEIALRERVKELECLYGIDRLIERCGDDLGRLLQGVADIIPPSWQYPEHTAGRVTLRGQTYVTARFGETAWRLATDITLSGATIGTVEIFYLEQLPDEAVGPFLQEEVALVGAIAEHLAEHVARQDAEHALQERYKELQCLYGIDRLIEHHSDDLSRLLQSVADIIPPSWQYPEHTAGRVTLRNQTFVTDRFEETTWRLAADISLAGSSIGVVEVFYLEPLPDEVVGPFLQEEVALIRAIADRLAELSARTDAEEKLSLVHRQLETERNALREANAGLRAVLTNIEQEKNELRAELATNVDLIVMPILRALERDAPAPLQGYLNLLREQLEQLTSPLLHHLSRRFLQLTPTEVAICHLIRQGQTSKDIAELRRVSPATVNRHREHIRRKLGLTNQATNLATFLQTFDPADHAA